MPPLIIIPIPAQVEVSEVFNRIDQLQEEIETQMDLEAAALMAPGGGDEYVGGYRWNNKRGCQRQSEHDNAGHEREGQATTRLSRNNQRGHHERRSLSEDNCKGSSRRRFAVRGGIRGGRRGGSGGPISHSRSGAHSLREDGSVTGDDGERDVPRLLPHGTIIPEPFLVVATGRGPLPGATAAAVSAVPGGRVLSQDRTSAIYGVTQSCSMALNNASQAQILHPEVAVAVGSSNAALQRTLTGGSDLWPASGSVFDDATVAMGRGGDADRAVPTAGVLNPMYSSTDVALEWALSLLEKMAAGEVVSPGARGLTDYV